MKDTRSKTTATPKPENPASPTPAPPTPGTEASPSPAPSATPDPAEPTITPESILKTYSGSVNGVKRILQVTSADEGIEVYYKVGDSSFKCIGKRELSTEVTVGKYGEVWNLDRDHYGTLMWWSYDIMPDFNSMFYLGFTNNVESFILEGSGNQAVAVGYKTYDGKTHSLPTFEEMKDMIGADNAIPTPSYVPLSDSAPTPISAKKIRMGLQR